MILVTDLFKVAIHHVTGTAIATNLDATMGRRNRLLDASAGARMNCKDRTDRIAAICAELLEIIDNSRANCENDECELVNCVVHDSVKSMRRVLFRLNTRRSMSISPSTGSLPSGDGKPVN